MLAWTFAAMAALPSVDAPIETGASSEGEAAVVVGIEDYFKLPDVPYAKADAEAFYRFLLDTRGVPSADVGLLNQGANREQILAAIDRAVERAGADGTVWVYFSGHGAASPTTGERTLLGADVQQDLTSFEGRAVRISEVQARAASANLILVLDTCYSGRSRDGGDLLDGKRFAVPDYAVTRSRSRVEWSAASAAEFSGPLHAAGHGAFTYFVLGALRGWADADGNGVVTAAEAQEYVVDALAAAQVTDQNPVLAAKAPDTWELATLGSHSEAAPSISALDVQGAAAPTVASFDANLDVSDALARKQCDREGTTAAQALRATALQSAVAAIRQEGTRSWAKLKPQAQACLELDRADRGPCVETLNAFVAWSGEQRAVIPTGFETVGTACGAMRIPLEERSQDVPIEEGAAAREMLRKMGEVTARAGSYRVPERLGAGRLERIHQVRRTLQVPVDTKERPRKFAWSQLNPLAPFADGRFLAVRYARLGELSKGAKKKQEEAGWPDQVLQFTVHDANGAVLEVHETPSHADGSSWRLKGAKASHWMPTPSGGLLYVVASMKGTARHLHVFEGGDHRVMPFEAQGVWPADASYATLVSPDRLVTYTSDRVDFWDVGSGARLAGISGQYVATLTDAAGTEVTLLPERTGKTFYTDRIERYDVNGSRIGEWGLPASWTSERRPGGSSVTTVTTDGVKRHVGPPARPLGSWHQRADRLTRWAVVDDGPWNQSRTCIIEGQDMLVGGDVAVWRYEVTGSKGSTGPGATWGPFAIVPTGCGTAVIATGEGRVVHTFRGAFEEATEQGDTLVVQFTRGDYLGYWAIDRSVMREDLRPIGQYRKDVERFWTAQRVQVGLHGWKYGTVSGRNNGLNGGWYWANYWEWR